MKMARGKSVRLARAALFVAVSVLLAACGSTTTETIAESSGSTAPELASGSSSDSALAGEEVGGSETEPAHAAAEPSDESFDAEDASGRVATSFVPDELLTSHQFSHICAGEDFANDIYSAALEIGGTGASQRYAENHVNVRGCDVFVDFPDDRTFGIKVRFGSCLEFSCDDPGFIYGAFNVIEADASALTVLATAQLSANTPVETHFARLIEVGDDVVQLSALEFNAENADNVIAVVERLSDEVEGWLRYGAEQPDLEPSFPADLWLHDGPFPDATRSAELGRQVERAITEAIEELARPHDCSERLRHPNPNADLITISCVDEHIVALGVMGTNTTTFSAYTRGDDGQLAHEGDALFEDGRVVQALADFGVPDELAEFACATTYAGTTLEYRCTQEDPDLGEFEPPANFCPNDTQTLFSGYSLGGGTDISGERVDDVFVGLCRYIDGSLEYYGLNTNSGGDIRLAACQEELHVWVAENGDVTYRLSDQRLAGAGSEGLLIIDEGGHGQSSHWLINEAVSRNSDAQNAFNVPCSAFSIDGQQVALDVMTAYIAAVDSGNEAQRSALLAPGVTHDGDMERPQVETEASCEVVDDGLASCTYWTGWVIVEAMVNVFDGRITHITWVDAG